MNTKLKRFLKEPLLHFLVIGFLIFFTSYYVAKQRDAYTIVLDEPIMTKLAMAWQSQFSEQPTSKDLQVAADDYIKQEVLAREAIQLGLNQDDEIIKRRLQQKMEFILKSNIIVPEPNKMELENYFKENINKFTDPPKVSFSHIYFSADKVGYKQAEINAKAVLEDLEKQPALKRAPTLGDPFMLLYDYNDIDKKETERLFGTSAFTDSLFTVKQDQWTGPLQSGYGWHLLYVNDRKSDFVPPLSEIRGRVLEMYKIDKSKEMDNLAMEELIDKYTVKIELDQ